MRCSEDTLFPADGALKFTSTPGTMNSFASAAEPMIASMTSRVKSRTLSPANASGSVTAGCQERTGDRDEPQAEGNGIPQKREQPVVMLVRCPGQ